MTLIPFIYPESPGQSLSIHSLYLSELQFQSLVAIKPWYSIMSLFLLDVMVYLLHATSAC